MENARGHDLWKTIAYSIASIGLEEVKWVYVADEKLKFDSAINSGKQQFSESNTLKDHEDSMNKIS